MTNHALSTAIRSWHWAVIAMFTMLPGCATADKSKALDPSTPTVAEIGRTHYTLRYGDPVKSPWPMPSMTPIFIDWHYADGHIESKLGFRAFDMNLDGVMDHLEVINDDGSVQASLSDFDFDGRPDETPTQRQLQ